MTFPAQQYAQQAQQYAQQPAAPQAFGGAPQQHDPAGMSAAPQYQSHPNAYAPQPAAPQQWAPQPGAEQLNDVDTSGMFGGAPSISWDNRKGYVNGTPRGGLIVGKKTSQQTDMETKQPKYFDAAKTQPMTQIEVTLQTNERTDANDDGKRTMYVKAGLVKAAAEAFRAVGAKDLELGAYFYAAKIGQNGGRNGKGNVFQCLYARPGSPDPLAGQPAYVAPAPQPQQATAPQWSGMPGQQAVAATGMDPSLSTPAMQQAAWQAQQQAPAHQFAPQQPQQGYADPNQGQPQYAPQAPAQPQQWDQQLAAQAPTQMGAGAPADYNPFTPR